MISRISGTIIEKKDGALIVNSGGMSYEVLIPLAVMNTMKENDLLKDKIELITYHYYQMEPSRAVPVLIGFQNEVEKEFFEKFISVSGVGPKAACKALAEPFSDIAGAIDTGDIAFLKKLPGIGDQRARLIIAKLQGKVGKYGLIKNEGYGQGAAVSEDFQKEALSVLFQLQYKTAEAEDMLTKAMERMPDIKTSEELLNEVYRERKTM
ncbi:MAG: Holliday junction DNA helicase RuvA [Candidatus Omnitrophica bacterium]|nr:Holliday junction DNA helicase RuvA [Candidatus Omnitrophota bacterium]